MLLCKVDVGVCEWVCVNLSTLLKYYQSCCLLWAKKPHQITKLYIVAFIKKYWCGEKL